MALFQTLCGEALECVEQGQTTQETAARHALPVPSSIICSNTVLPLGALECKRAANMGSMDFFLPLGSVSLVGGGMGRGADSTQDSQYFLQDISRFSFHL